mmetsp:Transcript_56325/g.164632  ORF Transcript_56325/g.164632 Transcript_56325/m.164632 type:complete len:216 (+) Transcript_56325:182-829(+)
MTWDVRRSISWLDAPTSSAMSTCMAAGSLPAATVPRTRRTSSPCVELDASPRFSISTTRPVSCCWNFSCSAACIARRSSLSWASSTATSLSEAVAARCRSASFRNLPTTPPWSAASARGTFKFGDGDLLCVSRFLKTLGRKVHSRSSSDSWAFRTASCFFFVSSRRRRSSASRSKWVRVSFARYSRLRSFIPWANSSSRCFVSRSKACSAVSCLV